MLVGEGNPLERCEGAGGWRSCPSSGRLERSGVEVLFVVVAGGDDGPPSLRAESCGMLLPFSLAIHSQIIVVHHTLLYDRDSFRDDNCRLLLFIRYSVHPPTTTPPRLYPSHHPCSAAVCDDIRWMYKTNRSREGSNIENVHRMHCESDERW